MQELLKYLQALQPGSIADVGRLESLLADCWNKFDGANDEGMEAYKLVNRMESVSWDPPLLSFRLERHGAAALGSTRAELQYWEVNVESRLATCNIVGQRQIVPMAPRLDVKPIAEEVADSIVNRQEDSWLKWNRDGSVRVLIGEILPSGSAVKQTLEGRRKRFRAEVERLLTDHGWSKIRPNVYRPPAS